MTFRYNNCLFLGAVFSTALREHSYTCGSRKSHYVLVSICFYISICILLSYMAFGCSPFHIVQRCWLRGGMESTEAAVASISAHMAAWAESRSTGSGADAGPGAGPDSSG